VLFNRQGLFHGSDNVLVSAAFTGERIAAVKTDDEGSQILGRAAYRFFSDERSNFQVGVSASRILNKPNRQLAFSDRPETRADGQQLVGFGPSGLPPAVGAQTAWHYGFEAGFNYGPFHAQGEYHRYGLDRTNETLEDPVFNGWYVQGSWFLTGEMRPYLPASAAWSSPASANPFALDARSWGAWEVKARYSMNDFNAFAFDPITANRVRGGEQKIISAGVNWYLNRNLSWMLEYLDVNIDRPMPQATRPARISVSSPAVSSSHSNPQMPKALIDLYFCAKAPALPRTCGVVIKASRSCDTRDKHAWRNAARARPRAQKHG
jgi:phosphate-selective porin OprO/OprP